MSTWGKLVGPMAAPDTNVPGWRADPKRPGMQRYWTGNNWDEEIPPRVKPDPIWRDAASTALGILIAAAALSVFWRFLY